jgi:hypothetical protein
MGELDRTKDGNDQSVTITINTTQGSMTNTFPKTAKIQDVLALVIQHFGFAQSGSYELRKDSEPQVALKPERTLVSYQVQDNDVFRFTDLGVAV